MRGSASGRCCGICYAGFLDTDLTCLDYKLHLPAIVRENRRRHFHLLARLVLPKQIPSKRVEGRASSLARRRIAARGGHACLRHYKRLIPADAASY